MPDWSLPYASRREPVLARNVVATSQPLAAQAGLRMLLAGGNAVDAALAAAITLTVVEPVSNGVGSDAFAILWDGEALHGLNASGRAPAGLTPERLGDRGEMPATGWDSVTVPGAVSAWVELSQRFGALGFEALFGPAIEYAREGFPVSPGIARQWELQAGLYAGIEGFAEAFLPGGRAPRPGETFRLPELGDTLEAIAATNGEAFYTGHLAERIASFAAATGGVITVEDLASHRTSRVTPIAIDSFGGARVHEIPPNTQGIAALLGLGLLEELDLPALDADSADALHLQIEATKLALTDVRAEVADPDSMRIPAERLLDRTYVRTRARLVDRRRAGHHEPGRPARGDTVYLCAADAGGRMISYIQSNYFGFGSGIVVPGTGISLQNRASGFTLEPGHPNRVGGGKRPFHTIIPGFVTHEGRPRMAFGLMGGPMQAQGHVQLLCRMLLWNQNPQAAADAPRWQWMGGRTVAVESSLHPGVRDALAARGHEITSAPPILFGGAQIIERGADGYVAGSEPRKDGHAVGF